MPTHGGAVSHFGTKFPKRCCQRAPSFSQDSPIGFAAPTTNTRNPRLRSLFPATGVVLLPVGGVVAGGLETLPRLAGGADRALVIAVEHQHHALIAVDRTQRRAIDGKPDVGA